MSAKFNPDASGWQYTAAALVAEKDYSSIAVYACYDYGVNAVYFDGIQLFHEEFGTSYTYDDEGNVISVIDLQKKNTEYEYDSDNNLTQIIEDDNVKMTYTYDEHHNVLTATTGDGYVYNFTYDTYGNNTSVSITEKTDSEVKKTITSSATYTSDYNYIATTTDALGNVTKYGYDLQTGLLDWVQYPEDQADDELTADVDESTRTNYTYDQMFRTATVSARLDSTEDGVLSASYTYEDDLLKTIETPSTTYTFTYGDFSLRTAVNIGHWNLATYSYESGTNRLQSLDYGNGNKVKYSYDAQGRLLKQTYEDDTFITYAYDNSGNLATVTDSETGIVTTYYYDLLNRQSGYREQGVNLDHTVQYAYDEDNNLASMTEVINGVSKVYTYTYDDDNRIISETVDGVAVEYTYDGFGRLETRTVKQGDTVIQTSTPTYAAGSAENSTTGQISSYNGYTYTYDKNGNILTISDGTNTISYEYDSQNQLIRELNQAQQKAYVWEYDNAGNILSKKEYSYKNNRVGSLLKSVPYFYTDQEWGDLLTYYNRINITYDTIGNPLNDGTWSYTWQHGRELVSMSDGTTTWAYTYGADGMRTKRTSGTDTYTYVYNGSKLTVMTKGNDTLHFAYDVSGTPLAVIYNGVTYYYHTNLQGDILGIKDSAGSIVVSYAYDAWGNLLSTTGTMADSLGTVNPLRYRGYVYDTETALYYLQSRYYNPEWGRFINADILMSTGQGFIGNNMFAYCLNNPVKLKDPSGFAGVKTALEFLKNWLTGNGEDKHYSEGSSIVKALRRSLKMQRLILEAIDKYERTGDNLSKGTAEFLRNEDGNELYLSTQKFDYTISVTVETQTSGFWFWKRTEKRYTATVVVHDTYDFDNLREWDSFGNVMNNIALLYDVFIGGNDFEWYATYTVVGGWIDA